MFKETSINSLAKFKIPFFAAELTRKERIYPAKILRENFKGWQRKGEIDVRVLELSRVCVCLFDLSGGEKGSPLSLCVRRRSNILSK